MSAARVLQYVRYLPCDISAGLGYPGDFATIRTRNDEFIGVVAFDANPMHGSFELSMHPTGTNWFSPYATEPIAYNDIVEIRCGTYVWPAPTTRGSRCLKR